MTNAVNTTPSARAVREHFNDVANGRDEEVIVCTIPGPPCAQGRGRAGIVRGKGGRPIFRPNGDPIIRVHDPAKSSSWKGAAQVHMREAMAGRQPLTGPVDLDILVVFPFPSSEARKTKPLPRRRHTKRGDWDNVGKAVSDAAVGVMFIEDALVSDGRVRKRIAAQGEVPFVRVEVRALSEFPGEE